jgi:sterol desaturase/sphingolipid hydroxylase (fatty acid hydroxylase superfamily)
MNDKLNFSCPVPLSQRPLQEYKSFKDSWGINWTTEPLQQYGSTFFKVLAFSFSVSFFLVYNSNYGILSFLKCLEYSLLFTGLIAFIIVFRLYLSWKYIYERLIISTVSYEESGWYDGRAFCYLEFSR